MKKVYFILFILFSFYSGVAQLDTANITITNFRLHEGTFNWRGTNTYFNRTNFDSSPYIEGHLKHYNGTFRQNFRLLVPQGYDPNYEPGYPLMVVWHGAVERGNCFEDNCYHGTRQYNPNTEPIPTENTNLDYLLNNDHQLLHGANPHIAAWNTAGTRKVEDPGLPVRAFPGFVMFAQNLNGWGSTDYRDAIRIVRLLLKKYNINQDRVYTHGLSNGGQGLLNALVEAPWLFAAAAPMSAVTSNNFRNNADKVAGIPLWYFQGGQDDNPTQNATETTISIFRAAGGNVRYTLYPNLGHGTWNTAYREPDFFSWFLGNTKADIHISYGSPTICGTNGEPAKLNLPAGFFAYQWERDGVIIPGATSHTYNATTTGVYRGRYSRLSANPTEAQWNRWSSPVTITEAIPAAPKLDQVKSIHLPDINGTNNAVLSGPAGFQQYYWYKDGELTNIGTTVQSPTIIPGANPCTGPCPNGGTYTLVTTGLDNCPSAPSNPKTVFFRSQAPVNIPVPTGFTATLSAPTSVLLRWNDVSGLERHYEIWRKKSTDAGNAWTFVILTNEDAITHDDRDLDPGTEYWYKIRAVSNEGRSDYAPANANTRAGSLVISTLTDTSPPTAPQNLTAELLDTDIATTTSTIRLTWAPSTDDQGVLEYEIRYGNITVPTGSTATTFDVSGLPLNTYFNFSVVARDRSQNISPPSNQATANTFIDGFFWIHSTAAYTDIRDIPLAVWNSREFEGRSPNLTLEPRTQEDFLIFRFYGYIYLSTAGMHQFRMRSNDGVELFLDGVSRIRRNGLVPEGSCATTNMSGNEPIFMEAGYHTIEVRYFQYMGDKCLGIQWRGPDADNNPLTWRDVPNERIRSYGSLPEPVTPPAPIDLQAVANGMTQIDLSWAFTGTPPVEYEIYRSLSAAGPFTVVNRVSALEYSDQDLTPGTTFYYRLRTITAESVSEYSEIASATTETDTEPPTQPLNLTLFSNTMNSASIAWTKSEDNTGVTGYEIWVNDILQGTAPSNFYLIENLTAFQNYTVYVVAFDANQNKSEPSNTISFETNQADIFYSKPVGNLNVAATWGRNPDGEGDAPLNFSTNGSYFIISNRTTTSVGGSWNVQGSASKIVVPPGVTLTAESSLQGRVEVQDNGMIILAHSTIPTFTDLGTTSTVQYNQSAQSVQRTNYGNLILAGSGTKTFGSGVSTIFGNLSVANGLGMKGAANNQSTVILYGDLMYAGTPGTITPDVALNFEFRKNGTQVLSHQGTLNLFQIKTSPTTVVEFQNGDSPVIITVGSNTGGGISLANGSSLRLGSNTLRLTGNATINSAGETGTIHVDEGTIDITSSSAGNSNLYVDETNNQLFFLGSGLSGTGTLTIQTPIRISDGLKIRNGILNANGNVTLLSTEAKTANLQEIENNGSVNGNVHVERAISLKSRTYRYMASPVEGTTVADWQNYFAITGTFTGASTGPGLGTTPSLYYYSEDGWTGYPSTTNEAPIERGRGYAAFVRNTTPFKMVSTGRPHQGTIPFTVFPPQPGVDDSGWNLLGNPFASTISWNNTTAWTKTQISTVVAVRNNFNTTSGQFQYYDAATGLGTGEGGLLQGGRIAPGQAFWIQTTGPNPAISITERAKNTGQQEFYREGTSDDVSHLKIALRQNAARDEALILLTDFGTDKFDREYDGLKMDNEGMFNFSTMIENNIALAINNLKDEFCTKQIALGLKVLPAGNYSMDVEDTETLLGVGTVTLLDHFTKTTHDFRENPVYNFRVTSDPASNGNSRFELVLERPALDLSIKGNAPVSCDESGIPVQLSNTQSGAMYGLYNGNKLVSEIQTSMGGDLTLLIPTEKLSEGINELQIQASFKGCSSAFMSERVAIEYYIPPVITAADVSVCVGSSANLSVSGTGNIAAYEWFEGETKIKGVSGPTFTTDPIMEEKFFVVAAVDSRGCIGPKHQITVTPASLGEPELIFENDTIFSTVEGAEFTWTRNGETLFTSHYPFIIPQVSGDYSVTITLGECIRTSRQLTVRVREENMTGLEYYLFPNPTTPDNINLTVISDNEGDVYIRVIDMLGKESFSGTYSYPEINGTVKIQPLHNLNPGVYFLLLEQESRREKIKFIIKQ